MMVRIVLFLMIFLTGSASMANEGLVEAFRVSYEREAAGELEQAVQVLEQVYQPDHYELNVRLGWLNYEQGSMDEALKYYRRAVDLKPYAVEPKLGLALPLSALGRWEDIIELYREVLRIDPQNSLVNYRMGLIYYNRGEYEQADPYLDKVVNLYPFDYDSLLLFAWNKLMLRRSREARVLFEKVLLASPGDASALRGLELLR